MKIGISGASGSLGSFAVRNAMARGAKDIVAISRSPVATNEVESRIGDYSKPEELVEAYRGLDSLLLIPSNEMQPLVRAEQNHAAIDAAIAAGVSHIVMISTSGIYRSADTSMTHAYWSGEQHLMKSAMSWNVLRMNYFAESFAHAGEAAMVTGTHLGLGPSRIAFVSRDDVAAAAVGLLLGKGHPGGIYNATGPSALTGEERAAVLTAVYGKKISFAAIDERTYRENLAAAGMPGPFVDAIMEIEAGYIEGIFDIVTGDVERLAEASPRSLEAVLRGRQQSRGV